MLLNCRLLNIVTWPPYRQLAQQSHLHLDPLARLDDTLVGLHNVILRRCRLDLEGYGGTRVLTHNGEACGVLATVSVVKLELPVVWEQSNEASCQVKSEGLTAESVCPF